MRVLRPMLIFVVLATLTAPGTRPSVSSLGTITAAPGSAIAAPAGRPNIIFILTDDQDTQSVAVMPRLKTLLIDRGTSFSNFFVTYSLCCPSRSTILRGQYPHNHQVLSNTPPNGGFARFHSLGNENSTIATWLRGAGYRTVLMGKYLNGYPTGAEQTYVPPGWDEWYSPIGNGGYANFNYTLNENGKLVQYGRSAEDYLTDVLSRKGVDFIRRTTRESRPFFIYLATFAPHAPATPAPRHQHEFANAKLPRSPSFNEADMSDKPEWLRNRPPLTPRQIDQLEEHYRKRLQALQAVDELLGALISELQAQGQLGRTYIFFMSDNGFHLGEHRLMMGKDTPYEEDLRVPMIVRGPGVREGKTVPHTGLNNDFAPTWAELAGVSAPGFIDGRSLIPLLGSSPPPVEAWRQAFLDVRFNAVTRQGGPAVPDPDRDAEEPPAPGLVASAQSGAGPPGQAQVTQAQLTQAQPRRRPRGGAVPEFHAVRGRDFLYVEYSTGERELYDLRTDLYELQSLHATADLALLRRLAAFLAALRSCAAASCRSAENAVPPALPTR